MQHNPGGEAGKLLGVSPDASTSTWQALLADAIRDVDELWRVLALPTDHLDAARAATRSFPLLVPRGFAALMTPGDLYDPLLRQVLPLAEELSDPPGFTADPLHEADCSTAPGLLRKYAGRSLLVTTGACAVHCRYCFRRHFPYQELPRGQRWWTPALTAIANDPACEELILSGGDPLTLPNAQIQAIISDAAEIPHLTRLRIHTRLPVVLPERVDHGFIAACRSTRLNPVMVIHANHERELSSTVTTACDQLRRAGVLLMNQSVLLAGINDTVQALANLSRRLIAIGVQPYYLHQLDHVSGAAHFAVSDGRAKSLIAELATLVPGYLVPRLVREEPGRLGKTSLA